MTKFKNFSQAGVGLMEVVVALGLSGVLVVVLMQLSKQQSDQQKSAMRNIELTEIQHKFVGMYSGQTACDATFGYVKMGETLNEFRVAEIQYDQPPFAEVGEPFQALKVYIEEMKVLSNAEINTLIASGKYPGVSPVAPSTAQANIGHADIQFRVKFNRGSKGGIGSQITQKIFTIPVIMGKKSVEEGMDANQAKVKCHNLGGFVVDPDTLIASDNYNNEAIDDGAEENGPKMEVNCLVVDTNNVDDMSILKCRANKQ